MRILMVDVNGGRSSTGALMRALMHGAQAAGHEALLCYGRGPAPDEDGLYKFGLDAETKLHALLTRLTGWTGCFSPLSTRRLIRKLDTFHPDVVHLSELHAYFIDIKPFLQALQKRGLPVVWTFHCDFMLTGKCGVADNCTRFTSGCGNCPRLREYPATLLFDHTHAMWKQKKALLQKLQCLRLTTPSQWLKERVALTHLADVPCAVIPNGVDTAAFYPQDGSTTRRELGISGDQRAVLAVGADLMSDNKGGRYVLELARRMPETRFWLVDSHPIEQPLPENCAALSPNQSRPSLARLYNAADAFLMCSRFETFSMTCAEALCCGTPVCGFRAGAPETVFDEPYARFVPYGDLDALEKQLRQTLAAPKPSADIAAYAQARFPLPTMVDAMLAEYRQALEG